MNKAALILNGSSIAGPIVGDKIICADGGYNLAIKYGIKPDYIIGDMDSIGEYDDSIEVVKFTKEKEKTDGELAVLYAANRGCKKLHIYGADGGRLDHVISNISLLFVGLTVGVRVTIHTETCIIYLAHSTFILENMSIGEIVSIVPFSERVHINSTKGLKYEIKNAYLRKGTSRGISNIVTSDSIMIDVSEGEALVFRIR